MNCGVYMKTYFPSYYDKFSCIAGDCPDSCCKAWEIVIDEDTLCEYKKLTGDIGERIRKHLITNQDGDCCFSLVDGKCPFLNESGLCDIHIALGEKMTSRICQDHPRFIEEYDGFTEISLSLSCPVTVKLILNSEEKKDIYPFPQYKGNDEILHLLIDSRKKLLDFTCDFSLLINIIFDEAADVQNKIDLTYIQKHPAICIDFINDYLDMLLNGCDILNCTWEQLLENTINSDITIDDLKSYIDNNNEKLIRLCKYFIYRYYLKAINDSDLYSRALFIVMSCVIICCIALSNSMTLEETARMYSKETEHNLENIDAILDYFFDI